MNVIACFVLDKSTVHQFKMENFAISFAIPYKMPFLILYIFG